jgi:CubicO group peptidase (beta-lactamase class C family)
MRQLERIARRTGLVAILLLAASLTGPPAGAQPAPVDNGQALDALFARWNHSDTPGCALGVAAAGAPPVFKVYGSADLEHDVPIRADTVFEAGSVSKQFTAASILLLVQQGKLALSDDVRRYLPELPDYGSPVTIDDLLSHTSGLRDWGEVEALAGWPRTSRVYTPSDVLAITARQRSLNYPPGTKYSYTNTGYNLAAIIVERLSGQNLARFSQEHLFTPLSMTHTSWRDDFRRIVKGRAIAYAAASAGHYEQLMPFEDTYGHGGLLTTVGDLLKWNEALTRGALGAQVTAALQHPASLRDGQPIGYARGLTVGTWLGTPEVAHSGATAAYRTWLGRYPQAQLSLALLCNAADAESVTLAHSVAKLFLPAQAAPASARTAPGGGAPAGAEARSTAAARLPDPQQLARLAGRYASDEALATWVVQVSEGHLTATPMDRRGLTLDLRAEGPDTFTFANPYVEGGLRFDRDGKGAVTGFTMSSPRVYALKFVRAANP